MTLPPFTALISLTLLWPARAATIGEFGILQGSANGGIAPALSNQISNIINQIS